MKFSDMDSKKALDTLEKNETRQRIPSVGSIKIFNKIFRFENFISAFMYLTDQFNTDQVPQKYEN